MGVIQRQGIKGAIATYLGVLIGTFNFIWLYPKFLPEELIGLIKVLESAAKIFLPFVALGITSLCIRFFPYFKDKEKEHNGFLFFVLLVPSIGFLSFLGFYALLADVIKDLYAEKSPLFADYIYLIIPLCFFFVFTAALDAFSRALQRIVVPNLIREFILRLAFTFLVLLFAAQILTAVQFVHFYVFAFGIVTLLLVVYIRWLGDFFLRPNFQKFTPELSKEMRIYALFSLLSGAGGMLVTNIDSLMVTKFRGLGENGVYSIAVFLGTVIEIPRRAVSQISGTIVADDFIHQRLAKIHDLYKRISINQFIIGALLLVGIWVNIDNLFDFIPNGEVYRAGKYVVLLIGLAKVFDMLTSNNSDIIAYSEYYRFNLVLIGLLVILTYLTNLYFIPNYGITGAAFATASTVLLYNIGKCVFVYWKFRMQPFTLGTLKVIAISGVTLLMNQWIPYMEHFLVDMIIRSLLIGGVFCGMAVIWQVSEDVNRVLKQLWNRLGMK